MCDVTTLQFTSCCVQRMRLAKLAALVQTSPPLLWLHSTQLVKCVTRKHSRQEVITASYFSSSVSTEITLNNNNLPLYDQFKYIMQELSRKNRRKFKEHKIQVSFYMLSSQRQESSKLHLIQVSDQLHARTKPTGK